VTTHGDAPAAAGDDDGRSHGAGRDGAAAAVAGARRCGVLAVGVFPFAVVYGVAVARSGVNAWVGGSASVLVFAGASQLSLLQLHDSGAAWLVVVGTALAINARFVLYSAALAPAFGEFPPLWRHGLPHLMTDQAATLSIIEYETDHDPFTRRWFYLGAALALFVSWQLGSVAGILLGAEVPEAWQLAFIIPLMFLALAVPALTEAPAISAAVTSVVVTVLARGLPPGTNILVGALCGLAVGGALVLRRPGTGGGGT
jgi:predicted branched-subunit amino acid permease